MSSCQHGPRLTVDDSLDTSTTSLTLGPGSLTGSLVNGATVMYSDLTSLTIKGGSGGSDQFTINGTPASITTTLDTGTGSGNHPNETTVEATGAGSTLDIVGHNTQSSPDSVTLSNAHSAQGLLGTITISNTPGKTSLTVDDSADTAQTTANVSAGSLTGLAPATINYADLSALLGRGRNSEQHVQRHGNAPRDHNHARHRDRFRYHDGDGDRRRQYARHQRRGGQ